MFFALLLSRSRSLNVMTFLVDQLNQDQNSKSLNLATQQKCFLFQNTKKTNRRCCYIFIFSWSLHWKMTLRVGGMWAVAADLFCDCRLDMHLYPHKSSYPPMTWNHHNTGTGRSRECWCTGHHHTPPRTLHTHQCLCREERGSKRVKKEKLMINKLPSK